MHVPSCQRTINRPRSILDRPPPSIVGRVHRIRSGLYSSTLFMIHRMPYPLPSPLFLLATYLSNFAGYQCVLVGIVPSTSTPAATLGLANNAPASHNANDPLVTGSWLNTDPTGPGLAPAITPTTGISEASCAPAEDPFGPVHCPGPLIEGYFSPDNLSVLNVALPDNRVLGYFGGTCAFFLQANNTCANSDHS